MLGMENCKPAATPVATGTKLKLLKATEDSEILMLRTLYQSAVGMYFTFQDGPDQISHLLLAMLRDSALGHPKNIG